MIEAATENMSEISFVDGRNRVCYNAYISI